MVSLDGFVKVIKEVVMASGLPVLADADTGFGEGEMCSKTVWEYYMAGASGRSYTNIINQAYISRIRYSRNVVVIWMARN